MAGAQLVCCAAGPFAESQQPEAGQRWPFPVQLHITPRQFPPWIHGPPVPCDPLHTISSISMVITAAALVSAWMTACARIFSEDMTLLAAAAAVVLIEDIIGRPSPMARCPSCHWPRS
ncbi:MAG: hypothetical protein ERJ67_00855 [Aphanocapsa feldmannii 277cV]|uniref:Uncharacterized protein n=1 Tax=Aphanocapsa feldmannii 277cV TaxID=2507553 RepID=A0A524RQY4_9CHRO|nr:MAG: hypothetical protein ERJ67_00855 [Aphanocapsa feldmannii 277cV]